MYPGPNGPGYIQCVSEPSGTDVSDDTSITYPLTISCSSKKHDVNIIIAHT
jgi:hypothetical protein